MKYHNHPSIVLASTSKYRAGLLSRLGISFESANPAVDETPDDGESPKALASRLALAKSQAVIRTAPNSLIIGSDQVASINNRLIGKPGDMQRAIDQLKSSSDRCVEFHTAVSVTDLASKKSISRLETTRVHFRPLSHEQIVRYLETERPFDCAGSFKAEGLGIALFRKIESNDPTALVGLPLIALVDILSEFGLEIP